MKPPNARRPRGQSRPRINAPNSTGQTHPASRSGRPRVQPPAEAVSIDEEFCGLIPPLSADERARLERSLLRDGCRDPLVIWAGHGVLLDGHNRLEICRRYSLPFRTIEVALPDREAARAWVIEHQKGRRNLTPLGESYLRGKHYLALKRQGQRNDLTAGTKDPGPASGTNGQGEDPAGTSDETRQKSASERLAEEYGVKERTIRTDAAFATAVNILTAACGEEVRRLVLSEDGQRLSRGKVEWWAEQPAAEQRRLLKIVRATGRLDRPRDGGPEKRWMKVPCELVALGETLLRRLGPAAVAALCRVLMEGLQERERDGR